MPSGPGRRGPALLLPVVLAMVLACFAADPLPACSIADLPGLATTPGRPTAVGLPVPAGSVLKSFIYDHRRSTSSSSNGRAELLAPPRGDGPAGWVMTTISRHLFERDAASSPACRRDPRRCAVRGLLTSAMPLQASGDCRTGHRDSSPTVAPGLLVASRLHCPAPSSRPVPDPLSDQVRLLLAFGSPHFFTC